MLVDPRFRGWRTRDTQRLVLVVARTATALNRILDVVSLLETDHRVQVVFTTDPGNAAVFGRGIERSLAGLDAVVVPWELATATRFDLVVAASENDRLAQLHGPILLVAHGIGHQKFYPNTRVIAGLDPARLAPGGRIVPAAIALSHPAQRGDLSPPAAARAEVIGDPGLARLLASRHRRWAYRAALGAQGRTLVLLASTWGPASLFGLRPELPERVAAALPADEYRVALALHPGVVAAHGGWALNAWLTRAREAGVRLVPPEAWQAALTAADQVVSDEGSLALYAAALDKPLQLASGADTQTVPGSPLARLAAEATRFDVDGEIRGQLDAARAGHRAGAWDAVVRRAVDPPEGCADALRPLLYRLLALPEPPEPADFPPADAPTTAADGPAALVVGAHHRDGVVALQRFPVVSGAESRTDLDHRHLVADVDRASVRQLGGASVLCIGTEGAGRRWFAERAVELLAEWPTASLVAAAADATTCWLHAREGPLTARAIDPPVGFDPLSLASLVFAGGAGQLLVRGEVTEVVVAAG